VRALGVLLYAIGGIGALLIDLAASYWLYAVHGIGWVFLAWITVLPLLVLPFLAGLGVHFIVAGVLMFTGMAMADIK
jgi:hypothetical protein